MSVLDTVLVFAGIPAIIYGVIALLTLRDRARKTPRYRPGQDWDYAPVWWSASSAGGAGAHAVAELEPAVPESASESSALEARTAWGGARGSW